MSKIKKLFLALVATVCAIQLTFPALAAQPAQSAINGADTVWVLISAALVMLMTPAVGLFYGGMVRKKNVIFNDHAKFHRSCTYQHPVDIIGI